MYIYQCPCLDQHETELCICVSGSKCDLQEGWYEVPLPPEDSEGQQTGETQVDTNLLFTAAKKYMWKHVKNSKHFGWLPSNILSLFALVIKFVWKWSQLSKEGFELQGYWEVYFICLCQCLSPLIRNFKIIHFTCSSLSTPHKVWVI